MMSITLQTITLITAGLMVGNELAVSAFVHPQLCALEDQMHATAAQAFARVYGTVMPFWYALTLVLTIVITFLLRRSEISFLLSLTAAALWSISILLTMTRLVPINHQVSHWNLGNLPHDWRQLRQQWDRLHKVRVVILGIALACLTVACVGVHS